MLEKIFKLKQHKTTIRTELIACVITFLTMSYILVVNPNILGATGMDRPALFTATALAAILGTMVKINFDDMTEALPAFFTIVMMPFTFSIAQGIVFGMLSFVFLKALSGNFMHISATMWVIFALFIVKIVLDSIGVL